MDSHEKYGQLLIDVLGLNIEIPPQLPLPDFDVVYAKDVSKPESPMDEPLVPLLHHRIQLVNAYFAEGYEDAYPGAHLRETVAARLFAAADSLPERFGFAVLDAWRSNRLQRVFYDESIALGYAEGFTAPPVDDYEDAINHPVGTTIDMTLTYDGMPLALGTQFDEMVERAYAHSCENEPGSVRELRRLMFWAMSAQGFVGYHQEWWEYQWGSRYWAAVTGDSPLYVGADIDVALLRSDPTQVWSCPPRKLKRP